MPKVMVKKPGKKPEVVECKGEIRFDCKPLIMERGDIAEFRYIQLKSETSPLLCIMVDENGIMKDLDFNVFLPILGIGEITVMGYAQTGKWPEDVQARIEPILGDIVFMSVIPACPKAGEELDDFKITDLTEQDIAFLNDILRPNSKAQLQFQMLQGMVIPYDD